VSFEQAGRLKTSGLPYRYFFSHCCEEVVSRLALKTAKINLNYQIDSKKIIANNVEELKI